MGRKGGLTGLARFVQQAFSEGADNLSAGSSTDKAVLTAGDDPRQKKALHPRQEDEDNNIRPSKKRKKKQKQPDLQAETDFTFIESWDATGLVPFCAKASQVPENLRKCLLYFPLLLLKCLMRL